MAKFKVGDKVLIDVWPDKGLVGTVKELDYGGHPGNVYVDYGTGAGSVPESKLRPANSTRSTNPVVANAMRASGGVAMNGHGVVTNTMGDGASDAVRQVKNVISDLNYVLGFKLNKGAGESAKKAYSDVVSIVRPIIASLKGIQRDLDRARKIADSESL